MRLNTSFLYRNRRLKISYVNYSNYFKVNISTGSKVRSIIVPRPLFKEYNTRILNILELTNMSKIHSASCAWSPGSSVLKCIQRHLNHKIVAQFDLKDYFNQINYNETKELFKWFTPYLFIYTNKQLILPQGFPTSPYVANAMRYSLDEKINAYALENELTYSAYGDNLILSGNSDVYNLVRDITAIVSSCNFKLKTSKTEVMKLHHKQKILGVVINDKPRADKVYVKKLIDTILNTPLESIDLSFIGKVRYILSIGDLKNYTYITNLFNKIYKIDFNEYSKTCSRNSCIIPTREQSDMPFM